MMFVFIKNEILDLADFSRFFSSNKTIISRAFTRRKPIQVRGEITTRISDIAQHGLRNSMINARDAMEATIPRLR